MWGQGTVLVHRIKTNTTIVLYYYCVREEKSVRSGLLEVEIALWTTTAKLGGQWYKGVPEGAETFIMNRWHKGGSLEEPERRAKEADNPKKMAGKRNEGVRGGGRCGRSNHAGADESNT